MTKRLQNRVLWECVAKKKGRGEMEMIPVSCCKELNRVPSQRQERNLT